MSAGDFTPLRGSAVNPATTPPRTPAQLAAVAAKTAALRDFLQAAIAEFGAAAAQAGQTPAPALPEQAIAEGMAGMSAQFLAEGGQVYQRQ